MNEQPPTYLIQFGQLNELLIAPNIGTSKEPVRLTTTIETTHRAPFTYESFMIYVQTIDGEGHLLTWRRKVAEVTYLYQRHEEDIEKLIQAQEKTDQLAERIKNYIARYCGMRPNAVRTGLISAPGFNQIFPLQGSLPNFDLFEKEEDIAET